MKKMLKKPKTLVLFLAGLIAPVFAYAHEVYVLTPEEIKEGLGSKHLNPLSIIAQDENQFLFWFILTLCIISLVFFISISRRLEDAIDPFLIKLKHYAPFIARITIGSALIASAYEGALFGPEITLSFLFGSYASMAQIFLVIIGVLMMLGLYARIAAIAALIFFAVTISRLGIYMLTYANYFGEMLVLLLIGSHKFSIERMINEKRECKAAHCVVTDPLYEKFSKYTFLIIRVAFGISLIYASFYAKYLHSNLALQVVLDYNLTNYFPFDPLFIVFGASIIEMLLGTLFILGIELRFTAVFLGVFLTLSLLYFGEAVWPHIILFGVAASIFAYGYDEYSLEGRFFKKKNREPIF